jgi:hypothetical protein
MDASGCVFSALPIEHPYRLKSGNGKTYVSEPRSLDMSAIGALTDLARKGWRVTVEAAGALFLPGETLHVVIRPRPVFGRADDLRAMTERDPCSSGRPPDFGLATTPSE